MFVFCCFFLFICLFFFFFFFSSRRRHTRSKRDWSSDVCSSDLVARLGHLVLGTREHFERGVFERAAVLDEVQQLLRRVRLPHAIRAQQQHVVAREQRLLAEGDRRFVRTADALGESALLRMTAHLFFGDEAVVAQFLDRG